MAPYRTGYGATPDQSRRINGARPAPRPIRPMTEAETRTAHPGPRRSGLPQPSPRLSDSQPRAQTSGCSNDTQSASRSGRLDDGPASPRKSPASHSTMPPIATQLPSPKHPPDMHRSVARAETRKPAAQSVYPELDRYRDFQRPRRHSDRRFHDAPQTPLHTGSSSQVSAISGSPSTRPSESPGYSRDTTPTSMLSSPVLASRVRPAVTRPPVSRRRAGSITDASADPHGLASVRKSSSSASTIREGAKRGRPLSPPPRKSSQKFSRRETASRGVTGSLAEAGSAAAFAAQAPSPQPRRHPGHGLLGPQTRNPEQPFVSVETGE